ncbi:MAG: YscO family type III secretion system apparatus protein [Dehalococcoidales bacterium]|nr:YscO family type III secretion system apparatus protein [Dehalococcoidales bacterium]
MTVTRQLYQLQELDLEIEKEEQSLAQKTAQLGDRTALDEAKARLDSDRKDLEGLHHRHRDAEAEVDDLLSKISAAEDQLYGGKVTNPKELSGLQHEVATLKEKSDELENQALEIIDQVENAEKGLADATEAYAKLEKEWQREQQQLSAEIDKLKESLADLNEKRRQMAEQIDPPTLKLYEKISQQKQPAVAKVEQGICRACRISLSASALQRARSGQAVQCGTCGRILYIS